MFEDSYFRLYSNILLNKAEDEYWDAVNANTMKLYLFKYYSYIQLYEMIKLEFPKY